MKVMIAGAQGQLGRCLQDRLAGTDHEVVAVGRAELDITNADAVSRFVSDTKPDVIINAAAYTAVDKAESERELAFAVNEGAVANLAKAANQVGALLVHVSTDYVFDGTSSRPYQEADAVNPMGVYGESKLAGEKAARQAQRHLIVRTAWVFSEYGNNFLKTMIRLGRERDSLSVVNDQIGTPTYAGDLAAALVQLAELEPANGVYHFKGGAACSWFDFAQAIFDVCSEVSEGFASPKVRPISTAEFPTPAKRPAYSVLDDSKLAAAGIGSGSWLAALTDVCRKVLFVEK